MDFSIITPTFNAAGVVAEAIGSVNRQSFRSFEHIIIDACSSDDTLAIISKYDHLRHISEPDRGVYDAMNKGVKMAAGDWLYFLGADDKLYADNVLENVSAELDQSYDVIYGDVVSDRFNGRYGGKFDHHELLVRNICHQAIFFNKRVFEKVGNFNLKYPAHSDWDHNLRWMLNPEVKSKHIDLIIADFADGGFSSVSGDLIFLEDKSLNYLQYGYAVLPFSEYFRRLAGESKYSIKIRDFGRARRCLMLSFRYGKRWLNRV